MTKRSHAVPVVQDDTEIRCSVLAYLCAHPQAADSLRGIVNWWLPRQRYENGCQRVADVLSGLVREGLLHRDELPDGEVLYALNRHTKPPN